MRALAALPEGMRTGSQRRLVTAVLEEQARVARLDGRGLDQRRGAPRLGDRGQIGMLETEHARVEGLHAHVVEDGPQRVQARLEHGLHAAVDPYHGSLVVLEVDDPRLVAQRARLGDHVQVLVVEPDVADRDDVDARLVERVPQPVTAGSQDTVEHAIAEEQSALVLTNLETSQHNQRAPPFNKGLRDGAPAATPRAWSAT